MPLNADGSALYSRWRVRLHLLFGRRAQALALTEERLQVAPGDPHALATRAHLLADAGRHGEALAALETLVSGGAATASIWFNLGYLRQQTGALDASVDAFRRAIALRPDLDVAWYGVAISLIGLSRLDEAAEALRENTRLQPMSPFGWYQLARVQMDLGQPSETIRIIRHLRRFDPRVATQLEQETGLAIPAH